MVREGLSISEIARRLKIARQTVRKYTKRKKDITARYFRLKMGRPRILTPGIVRRARVEQEEHKFTFARQLSNFLAIKCSRKTS
jgi:AcrR family transcriptional regulator